MDNLKDIVCKLQRPECLARSVSVTLDGLPVPILSLEALIASKRAAGRPRDLHAVLELEVIRERRNGGAS